MKKAMSICMLINIFIIGFCFAVLIASSLFATEHVSAIRIWTIITAALNVVAFVSTFKELKRVNKNDMILDKPFARMKGK